MKQAKTLKNTTATQIQHAQTPTSGPRRPGRPGASQGWPLALTRREGAARAHPTTRPARDAASRWPARGTRPRARAGRGWCAHEGLGAVGMLTRSTNGRSRVASGSTARSGGGGRRPTLRGSSGEERRLVRV
jgi:hypothetical protein